jgi:hypothetical protein
MVDLGRLLREQLREAAEKAKRSSATSVNVASAVNVDGSGHTTAVYSDDEVTIVQRDGETQVIRHRKEDPGQR